MLGSGPLVGQGLALRAHSVALYVYCDLLLNPTEAIGEGDGTQRQQTKERCSMLTVVLLRSHLKVTFFQ